MSTNWSSITVEKHVYDAVPILPLGNAPFPRMDAAMHYVSHRNFRHWDPNGAQVWLFQRTIILRTQCHQLVSLQNRNPPWSLQRGRWFPRIQFSLTARIPTACARGRSGERVRRGRSRITLTMPAPDMPRGMTFAEFVTTLATALTIINVYNTASVSSPGPGSSRRFSMRSASAQRRIRRRTVTSSTRLYLTMAVPYVAATVLVNRIPAEEVCPIYIAAVASVSGRFNKGRHTVLEWTFKALRTFTILFIMALFMLFQGLGDEPMISINEVHDIRMRPLHVLFSMFSSYRWFVILALGLVSVSPLQPRINVLLAALKIGLIWFILEGSGNVHAPGAWGVFDAVIITSTPLRNTVFILYSFLIFSDAAESVAFSILNQKNPLRSPSSSTPSASESDEGAFGTLQILRTPENDGLYTFEEYIKYSRDFTASVYSTIVNGRRKKKHDEEDKSYPGDEFDIEQGLPRRPG